MKNRMTNLTREFLKTNKRTPFEKLLSNFYRLLGCLCVVAAIAGGLYLGFWVCFIGGIVQVIDAVRAEAIDSMVVALGVARFMFAALVGWAAFFFGVAVCSFFFALAD